MTTIKPYDFLKLKNGSYLLVKEIKKRRVEIGKLEDLIIIGDLFSQSIYGQKIDNYIGLEGKSSKKYLNIKSCSFEQLSDFIFNGNVNITENYWIDDFSKIEGLISRNQTFKLKEDLQIL